MEHTKIEVFNKYLEIKKDLMANLEEVYNRSNYYSKKYRGNILTDINVGIGEAEYGGTDKAIQIYVRHNGFFIKDNIIYNSKGLFKSTIKSNLYE
tara:strand:+ start:2241 stop:2525 length:285 start_codon:yes stop_codon:yes gene_type:complete